MKGMVIMSETEQTKGQVCEVCGCEINNGNAQTTACPQCDEMRCEMCDMGKGTLCIDCDEGVDI